MKHAATRNIHAVGMLFAMRDFRHCKECVLAQSQYSQKAPCLQAICIHLFKVALIVSCKTDSEVLVALADVAVDSGLVVRQEAAVLVYVTETPLCAQRKAAISARTHPYMCTRLHL